MQDLVGSSDQIPVLFNGQAILKYFSIVNLNINASLVDIGAFSVGILKEKVEIGSRHPNTQPNTHPNKSFGVLALPNS